MKLKIKNFRSLLDTGFVEIKPLTILVGKNSSGKSSFLRHFPMLKQSFQENTRAPLLLYGKYVDFGTSFNDIKPKIVEEDTKSLYSIGFSFLFKDVLTDFWGRGLAGIYSRRIIRRFKGYMSEEFSNKEFRVEFIFNENKKSVIYVSSIDIEFLNNKIKIQLNENKIEKIFFNESEVSSLEHIIYYDELGKIIPEFYISSEKDNINKFFGKLKAGRYMYNLLLKYLMELSHPKTSPEKIEEIIEDIDVFDFENSIKKSINNKNLNFLNKKIRVNKNIDIIKRQYILFFVFEILLPSLSFYLEGIFLNVSYIAPLRATAERYYRIQSLAVNEVDPYGKNLPFFLGSLTETQMKKFQEWTEENFNFKVSISRTEGHYSIKILQEYKDINLADMGFGYSQILPILVQIWYSSSGFEIRKNYFFERLREKIIVIEQPELHLHPEFQAKFAEALIKTIVNSKKINLKIIVETHSDAFINRVGDCVLYNQISSEDINIVIFEKNKNGFTDMKFSNYDKEGYLENWPIGFFTPKKIRCN